MSLPFQSLSKGRSFQQLVVIRMQVGGLQVEVSHKVDSLPVAPGSLTLSSAVSAVGIHFWLSPLQASSQSQALFSICRLIIAIQIEDMDLFIAQ